MPRYRYRAWDSRTGATIVGQIDGPNEDQAILKLRSRELFPVELGEVSGAALVRPRWFRGGGGRVAVERRHFPKRLATLLRAGVPLVRAIDLLGRQSSAPLWKDVLAAMGGDLQEGRRLSDALGGHRWTFGDDFIGLIRAGERSGRLDACLERQAAAEEKRARLKSRVTAALAYPLVVGAVAALVLTGMMIFVVPRFEEVFATLPGGEELPALTRAVVGFGRWMHAHLGLLAAAMLVGAFAMLGFRSQRGGREFCRRLVGMLPGVGDLLAKAALARCTRTLGTLLEAGVPVTDAIAITATTAGHALIATALGRVRATVEAGEPMSRSLRTERVFPPLLVGLVEVGEESGGLPEMLIRTADVYEDEVDRRVEWLTSLLEPMLIVGLAVVVGVVVIALFLPIVRVVQALG